MDFIDLLLCAAVFIGIFVSGIHFGKCLLRAQSNRPARAALRHNRVVCAWCGEMISPGVEPVSHGICTDCFIAQDRQLRIAGADIKGPFMVPPADEREGH